MSRRTKSFKTAAMELPCRMIFPMLQQRAYAGEYDKRLQNLVET